MPLRISPILLLFFLSNWGHCDEWPQFRGPDGQGHVTAANDVPLEWSETKNIAWKAPIPGKGWSSPVISGNQIWLTTSYDGGRKLNAICVDRKTGKLLHEIPIFQPAVPADAHSQNTHASPTPVIDGEHVFVHFGRSGTACVSKQGKLVWKSKEWNYTSPHGGAASPIVHDDLLIVCCDGSDHQFVVALNKRTGKIVWKQPRAHMEDAHRKSREEKNDDRKGLPFIAFSTPLVVDIDGQATMISTPADHVVANRVATGEEVWWFPYNCFSLVARPVIGHGNVYAVGGIRDGHFVLYAIPMNLRGKIEHKDLAWELTKGVPHVPSPLLVGKNLFLMDDGGVALCIDAVSGETRWRKRLGGNYRASPIEINGKVYVTSQEGKTTVFSAHHEFKPLATNQLDGIFLASAAVAGQALYLRSDKHLYRIEKN